MPLGHNGLNLANATQNAAVEWQHARVTVLAKVNVLTHKMTASMRRRVIHFLVMDGRHGRHGLHVAQTADQRAHKTEVDHVKQPTVPGNQLNPRPALNHVPNGCNGQRGQTVTSVAVMVTNPVSGRAVFRASVTGQVVNVLHVIKASVRVGVNGVITVSVAMIAVMAGKHGVASVMVLVSVKAWMNNAKFAQMETVPIGHPGLSGPFVAILADQVNIIVHASVVDSVNVLAIPLKQVPVQTDLALPGPIGVRGMSVQLNATAVTDPVLVSVKVAPTVLGRIVM